MILIRWEWTRGVHFQIALIVVLNTAIMYLTYYLFCSLNLISNTSDNSLCKFVTTGQLINRIDLNAQLLVLFWFGNISFWYVYVEYTRVFLSHYDVIKWKHFPPYWPFVRRIHRSPVNSPHKGQWRGALMISLICVWINHWVNNREAGDLRRYHTHYAVIVMKSLLPERCGCNWKCAICTNIWRLIPWAFLEKFLSDECWQTLLMISQHWFR